MSSAQTLLLGAIAGVTIFIGLPIGRLPRRSFRLNTLLNGVSAGILLFLLFDIFSHAGGEVERLLQAASDGSGSWGRFALVAAIYAFGFSAGLLSLVYVAGVNKRRVRAARVSAGPGAMAVAEFDIAKSEALQLGMSIAIAIGLHNFSEGLAIGQAANAGEMSLALLLVVGFAMHNATEGFGIVGPLAAADAKPSWGWLALAGLAGGGPTFLGTVVGTSFSSPFVFVGFLAAAGGAIVYVVGELFAVGRRLSWETTLVGVAAGFLLAFAAELVLTLAGG